jgi:3-oxoadipate enol-lactonase
MAAQMAQTKALAVQFGMAANFEQVRPVIFASAALAADAAYIRDYSERFAAGDPEGFGISMAALSRIAVQGGLGQITLPTLVIVGDEDHLLPLPNSEAIAAGIPGARLEVIAGASHLSNLDKPDEFNALVRGFLDGLDQN